MTIYDIAKEAGVSPSSVSRVINNKPGIGEEKRQKIQALLDKYHYSPNEAARGLVMQSTKMVGVLMEDIRSSHHTESTYVVQQELMKQGYLCMAFSTGHTPEQKAQYISILEKRRVEGIILIGSMFAIPEIRTAIEQHVSEIPVVIVNGYLNLPNVYGILIDEEGGVADCVNLLVSKGKRNLVFAADSMNPANMKKKDGFLRAMHELQMPSMPVYMEVPTEWNPELTIRRGREITRRILGEHPDTDGIIYSDDMLAIGGVQEMAKQGLSIPDRIAAVGIDNTLTGWIYKPRLTTLDNKLVEVSENASRILLSALNGEKVSHRMMLFTDIIEGETT